MKVSSSNAHHISFQVGLQIVVVTILNQTFIVNHNLLQSTWTIYTYEHLHWYHWHSCIAM